MEIRQLIYFVETTQTLNFSEAAKKLCITTKLLVVSVLLSLCATSVSAQLEFSNWIVSKNTIMHIEPDGNTSLFTHNGICGDDYNYMFYHLLSDYNGNPIVKTGRKYYREKNGIAASDPVCTLNDLEGDSIYENDAMIWTPPPFMLKSPDNKYSYILHSSFNYDWGYDRDNDLLIRYGKSQIRCFCKDNFDDSDKGHDIIIHEYTRTDTFKDVIYGSATGGMQEPDIELPLFAGMSHTDGKSIWVIIKRNDKDSIVAINLNGSTIQSKKKSNLNLGNYDFWVVPLLKANYNVTDNGKIYAKIPNIPKTLCISFDQDKGVISDYCFYDLNYESEWCEITATGQYLYHTYIVSNNPKKNRLIRLKISDIENGIYNEEVITPAQQVSNELYTTLRIGIDGNIYVRNGKSIMVVYDSETDNPRFETLYTETDIPDFDINFPNYLYTYDLFACKSDCDRNATFSFPDPRNEIIAYEWDFGDGFKSTEITPTHQYAASGNYTVTLEVTLKNGSHKILPTRKIIIFDQKPSAKFDNAQVCDGEQLKITLTGTAPYQIFYTFNGENKSITTSDNEYLMNNITGRYQITKVTDQFCEYEPTQNNTAEILPPLQKLKIYEE